MLPPSEKRLRSDQRTGLDCIKQEYQEHQAAADYTGDAAKRLAANPVQEMPPVAGHYGHGEDQSSSFGAHPGTQPPQPGYWQTPQGSTHSDSYPSADSWNSQQQLPVKQEFGSGYPEPGFSQQDYNRLGFDNQSGQSNWAVGGGLGYSQVGSWNQGDYSQTSQIPGQPPQVSTSGAYGADHAMMPGAAQWGFPPHITPKVEPLSLIHI